jgi:hypothetical protein
MQQAQRGGLRSTRERDWGSDERSADDWLADVGAVDWVDAPAGDRGIGAAEGLAGSGVRGGEEELGEQSDLGGEWREFAWPSSAGEAARAAVERRRLIAVLVIFLVLGTAIAVPLVVLRGGDEGASSEPTTEAIETTPPPTTPEPTTTTPTSTSPLTVRLPAGGTLRLGDDSPAEIRRLQRALVTLGFEPGEVDGLFGPVTQAAVIEFQRSKDLDPDGIVGPKTVRALNKALAEQSG